MRDHKIQKLGPLSYPTTRKDRIEMQEETKPNYAFLSLQVIPLTLKVYDVIAVGDYSLSIPGQTPYYLDKIENIPQEFPIPENFHLVTREVCKGMFRYDLKLTFRPYRATFPFSEKFPVLYADLLSKQKEIDQIEVFWYLNSPEPLSKYQIESLITQHAETYPPPCHPLFVSFELIGAWKGQL